MPARLCHGRAPSFCSFIAAVVYLNVWQEFINRLFRPSFGGDPSARSNDNVENPKPLTVAICATSYIVPFGFPNAFDSICVSPYLETPCRQCQRSATNYWQQSLVALFHSTDCSLLSNVGVPVMPADRQLQRPSSSQQPIDDLRA